MDFLGRAFGMLEAIGWIVAHRVLFAELRMHLLGWPRFLFSRGYRISLAQLWRLADGKHRAFALRKKLHA